MRMRIIDDVDPTELWGNVIHLATELRDEAYTNVRDKYGNQMTFDMPVLLFWILVNETGELQRAAESMATGLVKFANTGDQSHLDFNYAYEYDRGDYSDTDS